MMEVCSRSENEAIKTGNFALRDLALEGAKRYSEWQFYYSPTPHLKPQGGPRAKGV